MLEWLDTQFDQRIFLRGRVQKYYRADAGEIQLNDSPFKRRLRIRFNGQFFELHTGYEGVQPPGAAPLFSKSVQAENVAAEIQAWIDHET